MVIPYCRWPKNEEAKYEAKGYWAGLPLCDIVTRRSEDDNTAVIDGDRRLSYRQLDHMSSCLASSLQKQGLKQGDTAIVQLSNNYELYVVFFALLKLGVVLVNALFSHRQLELEAYADQIQPRLLIADRGHAIFHDNSFVDHLRTVSPGLHVTLFRQETRDSSQSLDAFMEGSKAEFSSSPTPADEVAFFNLSGGSTGTPKLIPRTHNDYYYSVRQSNVVCRITEATRFLCAIPAAHNFPMSSPGALGVFYAGGQVIMAPDPSATSCFPLIEHHKVNLASLVPTAASLWLQQVDQTGNGSLRSLELLQVGGARLSPVLAAKLSKTIGCKLQQVLGMAEGLVNYTRLDDDENHIFTTQGYPMSPDDEVWVADVETGEPLPRGEVGLLMTRGPYTFRGYYKSPEHNAKSFDAQGFYCSGDLIAISEDGYITVHGRQKDQINRGGEKVAAEEIENLLLRHPDIIEAGIVAIVDDLLGEKSCAFIMVRKPVKPSQLRRFLRDQGIAEYKLPDKFQVVPELPLTAVGKVDKKELRLQLPDSLRD